MIQQRSLLQSDSREVHVGHYHLFFTRASRSKLSLANFRIESTEKKTRAVLQSSNFPLGYLSTSGPPSHPLLAYLTQSAHTMLWSHQFHIFLQGLQAPTCTAQGAPPKFSPRNSMAWHSWLAVGTPQICGVFPSISDKIPSFLASNLLLRQIQWASTVYNKLTQQCKIPVPL